MASENSDFRWTTSPNPHHIRVRQILDEHPEVRHFIDKNPLSFLIILACVALLILGAYLLQSSSWWFILFMAYVLGAWPSHALWVMIHECGHLLVFKGKAANFWAAIIANLPHIFPSAISFQHYHHRHHTHQSVHDYDGDLPDFWEAKFVSNSKFWKIIWLAFFPFFQIGHTLRLKDLKKLDFWIIANWIVQIAFNLAIWYWLGPKAFVFLLASFLFSVGLHPLGARWIQEHYLVLDNHQETYSYYGPLNTIAFNIGYHNEHHDFPSVPWNHLPKLKKTAPKYYDTLKYHKSWTKLLFQFIFDSKLSLYSRLTRKENY
jgi:sphingolipid 4-desaturase/C4-monooxygenase